MSVFRIMNKSETIRSKKGLGWYLTTLSLLLFGPGSLIFLVLVYIFGYGEGDLPPVIGFQVFGASVMFSFLLIFFSSQVVRVDKHRLLITRFWREHEVRWENVRTINVLTTVGIAQLFGFNLALYRHDRAIPTMIFSLMNRNSRQLNKAIIEAATAANPAVEIDQSFINRYRGGPPYGIFPQAETEDTVPESPPISKTLTGTRG